MSRPARESRKRPAVSYVEASDDEDDYASASASKPRAVKRRKRPASDDDEDDYAPDEDAGDMEEQQDDDDDDEDNDDEDDEDDEDEIEYEDDDDDAHDDEEEVERGTPEEQLALAIDREQYAKLLRERRIAFRVFERELAQVRFPLARACTAGYHFRAARKWIGDPKVATRWIHHVAPGCRQYMWEVRNFWGPSQPPAGIWDAKNAQVGTYTLVRLGLPQHSNVLVLDHSTKTAYIFEPHGAATEHVVFVLMPELNRRGFQLDPACVRKHAGPQDKELRSRFHQFLHFLTNKGNCLLWSCLWMHLMLECRTSPRQTAALLEAFSDDSTALLMMAYQTHLVRVLKLPSLIERQDFNQKPRDLQPHEQGVLNLRRRLVKGFAATVYDVNAMVRAYDGVDQPDTKTLTTLLTKARVPVKKSRHDVGIEPVTDKNGRRVYWAAMQRFVDAHVCVADVLADAARALPPASQRLIHQYLSGDAGVILALNGGIDIPLEAAQVLQMRRFDMTHKRLALYVYQPSEFPHLSLQQARQLYQPPGSKQVKLDARIEWESPSTANSFAAAITGVLPFASSVPLQEPVAAAAAGKKKTKAAAVVMRGLVSRLLDADTPFPWPYCQLRIKQRDLGSFSDPGSLVTLRRVTADPTINTLWGAFLVRLEALEEQAEAAEAEAEAAGERIPHRYPLRLAPSTHIIQWKVPRTSVRIYE